jgi:hypothetical protein
MIKIFIILLLFLLSSCSTYSVTVLHNKADPVNFIDPDTEFRKNDPTCKTGFIIKTNKNKKECIHR